jgi:ABC-type nitrate/sulfonate/bicarbonate transport system substrate-binding protein
VDIKNIKTLQGAKNSMTRRRAIAMAAALAAAAMSSVNSQSSNASLHSIIRGTVSLTAAEWTNIIATQKGFYTQQGLSVETVQISPQTIVSSLIGGSVQIGMVPSTQLILSIRSGANIVAIGPGMDPSHYSLVATKNITTLAGLKGKTIALADPVDAYTEVTKEMLAKAGLDPNKDVSYRYGGNSNQRMAALLAGAVDAVPLVPPQDQEMFDQGYHSIAYYADYYPNLAFSVLAVNRDWANANPELVKGYLLAGKAATAWLYDPANKAEAIKLLMKATKSDDNAATEAYEIYVTKLHVFPLNGCIKTSGVRVLISLLSKINQNVPADLPVRAVADTEWCPG